jgi:hypothetical protein
VAGPADVTGDDVEPLSSASVVPPVAVDESSALGSPPGEPPPHAAETKTIPNPSARPQARAPSPTRVAVITFDPRA